MPAQPQPLRATVVETTESADSLADRESRAVYVGRVRADLKAYLQTSRKSQATVARGIGMDYFKINSSENL